MYFLIENNKLLKTYNDNLNKVSDSVKKETDFKPIYNKELLKTKIRSYGDEATNFRKIPKIDRNYIC